MAQILENTMSNNNVYILTNINPETTNDLIAQLSLWVDKLQFRKPLASPYTKKKKITDSTIYVITSRQDQIYSPYEKMPDNRPVLNVYINSSGGKTSQMQSLLTLFNMASARGTIIKTYNLAHADSSASMIAVSGTRGYRYMSENAFNYIHFGRYTSDTSHTDEIETLMKDLKEFDNTSRNIYLNNTKLTTKELNKYYNSEGTGKLYAKECLEKELCDWIITNDGRFVNNITDLKSKKR